MKILFMFSMILIFLSSCREDQQTAQTPACLMGQPQMAKMPTPLPNLNITPIYIEIRSSWDSPSQNPTHSHAFFRLSYGFHGIQAELLVTPFDGSGPTLKCHRFVTFSQYQSLSQIVNNTSICKSIVFQSPACSMAMIAPSSLYLIDQNSGPLSVNLTPYALDGDTSICDPAGVRGLENLASSFFEDLQSGECAPAN